MNNPERFIAVIFFLFDAGRNQWFRECIITIVKHPLKTDRLAP